MGFETFKRQRARAADEPYVTIQKKGVFSLNHAAYETLGSPESVELLYDPDARLIGLRKVDPSVDHAYMLRSVGRGATTWLLSGTAFTKFYGIETEVSRRRLGRLDEDVLVVDLNDEGQEVRSNRNGAQRA